VTISVRPGSGEDRAFVADLAARTVMARVAAFRHATERLVQDALKRLLEVVRSQSNLVLIAERDGERAGFLLLLDELPDEVTGMAQAFVAYMAVEPQWQRRGIGAALMAAAEDEARGRGLPYITLMVTEDNVPARVLYERKGYFTERRLMCKAL